MHIDELIIGLLRLGLVAIAFLFLLCIVGILGGAA